MDDVAKINSLLLSGDEANIKLGISLSESLNLYDQSVGKCVQIFDALVPYLRLNNIYVNRENLNT